MEIKYKLFLEFQNATQTIKANCTYAMTDLILVYKFDGRETQETLPSNSYSTAVNRINTLFTQGTAKFIARYGNIINREISIIYDDGEDHFMELRSPYLQDQWNINHGNVIALTFPVSNQALTYDNNFIYIDNMCIYYSRGQIHFDLGSTHISLMAGALSYLLHAKMLTFSRYDTYVEVMKIIKDDFLVHTLTINSHTFDETKSNQLVQKAVMKLME